MRFGFFPENRSCEFDGGKITPIPEFESALATIIANCHQENGFLFTPTYVRQGDEKSPSYSPLHFKFFSTHEISMSRLPENKWSIKESPAFFVLQVAGYVAGYRLMPESFGFDLRVPLRPTINTHKRDSDFSTAINLALNNWRGWTQDKRVAISNLLFLFSRNPSYIWTFEQFDYEYKIIDSCWKLCELPWSKHRERLRKLLDHLEIGSLLTDEEIEEVVDLRNDLIHELSWGQDLIAGRIEERHVTWTNKLHRLNHRILGRMLGFEGEYFRSNPRSMGPYPFQLTV